jgi:ABC-type transport system involved in multi-copper enzyme maturation permease subunit
MFRVEIGKALRRWRTWLLAAALAGVPVLIVIAVKASPPRPQAAEDAPPFLLQIVRNGMFAPLTGLAVVQPFFMSLAIGLFISTLTDSGPGAIVATVIVAIASQVIDQIPNLHVVHPYVPTHGWLGFTGLFRFPVDWSGMRAGLTVSAVYTVVFLILAVWNFRRRDITS